MKIFGILNVTPDSFSDGGNFIDSNAAVHHARKMISDGAYALDVGAESTRPGAIPVAHQEEWARLQPVIEQLPDALISVDTRNAETAYEALKYPQVQYVNDVSGFESLEMYDLLESTSARVIVMHSLSIPADPNIILTTPPVETMIEWMEFKMREFLNSKIDRERIVFDPGLGFGKNAEGSIELLRYANALASFCHNAGVKIMFGHSRKSFMKAFSNSEPQDRDLETAVLSSHLLGCGVDYIRVHNVSFNQRAVQAGGAVLK